jgi:two-component system, OmpR family, heavy metal sensor histidine kinase CusS
MRSIRLSLMVYFLGLLTVALGVALFLVYRTAQRSLKEKEDAARKLIEANYEKRSREEKERLDEALLNQAQTLARYVQVTLRWDWMADRPLGVLGVQPVPGGPLVLPAWLAQAGVRRGPLWSPLVFDVVRHNLVELRLPPSEFHIARRGGGHGEDIYYQIESGWGGLPLRSPSLGARWFHGDPAKFAPDEVLHSEYDNLELSPGVPVRRVRLKVSSARVLPMGPPGGRPDRPRPEPPPGPRRGSGRPRGRFEPPRLALLIHCASDLNKLNAKLADLRRHRDDDLSAVEAETAASLKGQRNRLLLIGAVTFVATVLGSFWLVWLGLSPLSRLSEAVSRVSPKAFRLQLDTRRMPAELRPITQRLTDALAQLERAFAREKQATADISHELRTPLAALLANTELALRKPRSADYYRELLVECRHSAQQMHQIVERLLTLARLDAGVDRLRAQPVDVAEVAAQCAAVVRPLAEARGLRLRVEAPPPDGDGAPTRVTTDPDKLREVLTNLLHNAVEYNTPHGAIDLRVARDDGRVRVEVRDTGVGIAPDAREHIFERFYRADPSRGTDSLHAGLGLSIVKEYVDLMGGTIAVESAEGQGSTFRVDLPAR